MLTCRCKTIEKENDSDENNLLNILTHNLDPELAQQVKKYWFVPNTLCCQHLLGKGKELTVGNRLSIQQFTL